MAVIEPEHLKLVVELFAKEMKHDGFLGSRFKNEDIVNCVIGHSAATAVAAMAAGLLPGAASVVATGIAVASIWTMYWRICKIAGIKLKKNVIKALASAVLANIVTQFAGLILAEVVLSFVPGLAIVICGMVNFAVVYFAGLVFIKALTDIFKAKRDVNLNGVDIEAAVKKATASTNKDAVFKESKSVFNAMHKDGSLKKEGRKAQMEIDKEAKNANDNE